MACCNDYTRSQLLRGPVAQAGAGLPAIETGMPEPAGTGLSRRSFLSRSAGLTLAVYGASKFPFSAFDEGIAHAAGGNGRILVSLFFDGGIDSMAMLAPVGDPSYSQLRPQLGIAPEQGYTFAEDSRLRWHPAAVDFATLYNEGKVSVFPAIGYTGANQSHFTSRHFYEIGEVEIGARTGWLGRYVDLTGSPDNPLQGLSLDSRLYPSLATATMPVAAVESVGDYEFWTPGVDDPIAEPMFKTLATLGKAKSKIPAVDQARRASRQMAEVRKQLQPFGEYVSAVPYPEDNDLAGRLSGLAAMIAAGLPLSVVTANANGGYDTHSDQAADLDLNVRSTGAAIMAFQRDLEARGLADKVLIEVWSEFGRRPQENDSGTDHGAAGLAMLIGSRASGRMVGEFPGLAVLDEDDNLRNTTDFRAMYASLLEQWLGADAAQIIPGAGALPRYALLK